MAWSDRLKAYNKVAKRAGIETFGVTITKDRRIFEIWVLCNRLAQLKGSDAKTEHRRACSAMYLYEAGGRASTCAATAKREDDVANGEQLGSSKDTAPTTCANPVTSPGPKTCLTCGAPIKGICFVCAG